MRNRVRKILLDCSFLIQFSLDDFKRKYAGSFLGTVWAFLQPVSTILVYWFVFSYLKSNPVGDIPFILWLVSGLMPWFFISEAVLSGTASIVEYGYLVKKVMFPLDILPAVKLLSVLFVQIFLALFVMCLRSLFGLEPNGRCLEAIYYMLYMFLLVAGISYLTAAVYVFFRDLLQLVNIILQVIFWLTPMVWDVSIMPETVQKIIRWNPVYYIVTGYRNAFIYQKPFFSEGWMILYYWGIALILFGQGIRLFRKVRPHFADVL